MAAMRFSIGFQRTCSCLQQKETENANHSGVLPFLGYHHVLMILIAIAIILLCTQPSSPLATPCRTADTHSSSPTSRLFLLLAPHPQHLPHLPLLPTLSSDLRPRSSRSGRHDRNRQHRGPLPTGSQGRLFRHLHQSQRRQFLVQQQCVGSGWTGFGRSGSLESDLGWEYVQG